jgi:chromosomal replication initiation ATPase DnaA
MTRSNPLAQDFEQRQAARNAELDRLIAAGVTQPSVEVAPKLRIFRKREVRPPQSAVERILVACAAAYGVPAYTLNERSHRAEVAQPRQLAMWVVREALGWSLPRIGRAFGYHHTSVLHACRIVEIRRDDREWAAHTDRIVAAFARFRPPAHRSTGPDTPSCGGNGPRTNHGGATREIGPGGPR